MENDPDITIQPIKPEYHDAIIDIHEAIIKRFEKPQWKSPVRNRLDHENLVGFVALRDGKVVGFIISAIRRGDFGLDQSGWIEVVGVHPKYTGQGIGRTLAAKLFEHYRSLGIKDVYSSVRWDSADMLSFFKSLGFDRSNFLNLRKKLPANR